MERAFPFAGEGVPGGAARGGGEGGRSDREHGGGRREQPLCGGQRGAGTRGGVQQAMDRCGGGDRFAERADESSTGEGFETGPGTDGRESEVRGGIWRGEERGGQPGERQSRQRRSVLPGEGHREGEQPLAACAAGFCEYAGGV